MNEFQLAYMTILGIFSICYIDLYLLHRFKISLLMRPVWLLINPRETRKMDVNPDRVKQELKYVIPMVVVSTIWVVFGC